MGNQARGMMNGMSSSPTYQNMQQGFNNMGNQARGMMNGMSSSPIYQNMQQGLNNYGQQAQGYMSNLYNSQKPAQAYNQGSYSSLFGGRRRRTRRY